MAYSIVVAVADSDMMRVGRVGIVTFPLAAVTVTGKPDVPEPAVMVEVLDDEQAASRAAIGGSTSSSSERLTVSSCRVEV
jgi:hypothetical protein